MVEFICCWFFWFLSLKLIVDFLQSKAPYRKQRRRAHLYLLCEKYPFKCCKCYLTKNMILSIKLSNPTNSPRNSLNVIVDALARWLIRIGGERGRDRMRSRSQIRSPARGTTPGGVSRTTSLEKYFVWETRTYKWSIRFFLAYIFGALIHALVPQIGIQQRLSPELMNDLSWFPRYRRRAG